MTKKTTKISRKTSRKTNTKTPRIPITAKKISRQTMPLLGLVTEADGSTIAIVSCAHLDNQRPPKAIVIGSTELRLSSQKAGKAYYRGNAVVLRASF